MSSAIANKSTSRANSEQAFAQVEADDFVVEGFSLGSQTVNQDFKSDTQQDTGRSWGLMGNQLCLDVKRFDSLGHVFVRRYRGTVRVNLFLINPNCELIAFETADDTKFF